MCFLIGFILLLLGSNVSIAWETTVPKFAPEWINTESLSEISRWKTKLKHKPADVEILTRIGYLFTKRGQLDKAHRYLKLASYKGAKHSFFFLSKGLLHRASNKNSMAEPFLFKALLVNKQEDPQYFFHFAEHLLRTGQYSKSIHWLVLGLKLHPSQPQLMTLLAWNYISVADWNKAEITLIKARQLNQEFDQYISFNLSKMYAILGNWDSSIYNLRRATLNGYKNHNKIRLDKVFDPIRNHPQFVLLLNQAQGNEERFLNLYRFNKI